MNKKYSMKHVTKEWYLYHHIKNENALLNVIVISALAFFINPGVIWSFVVWFFYLVYCSENNDKLNKDPQVLRKREFWKQHHIKNGDWEECKKILGI